MSDIIAGDPVALAQFTTSATYAANSPNEAGTAYASSWATFVNAPGVTGAPPSKAGLLGELLQDLAQLDQEPGLFGQALSQCDLDGDGRLTDGDGFDATGLLLAVRAKVLDPLQPFDADRAADLGMRAPLLFEVVRDGSDGETRVVRLKAVDLEMLKALSPAELQAMLELYGLTGEDGPLQMMIHGFRTTTGGITDASTAAADLWDQQGVSGATVLAVDWDGAVVNFGNGYDNANATGDEFAAVFSAIAASNPDANVSVFAHSLGNNVGLRGLTHMVDPLDPLTGLPIRFQVDYTGVQPAIPHDAAQPDGGAHGGAWNYGALTSDRIKDLTLTINQSDDALGLYEYVEDDKALGDLPIGSAELTYIQNQRRSANPDSSTLIINQDDQQGGPGSEGHLGINPGEYPFVRWLADYQQERALTGTPPHGVDVAYGLVESLFPDEAAGIWADGEMQAYLADCAAQGVDPDLGNVAEIARAIEDR